MVLSVKKTAAIEILRYWTLGIQMYGPVIAMEKPNPCLYKECVQELDLFDEISNLTRKPFCAENLHTFIH